MDITETLRLFKAAGLTVDHEGTPNSEQRFSVNLPGGNAWTLTIGGLNEEWKGAHYHKGARESLFVAQDPVTVATLGHRWAGPTFRTYKAGEFVTFEPEVVHNIRLGPRSIIMTIQYVLRDGANPDRNNMDWWPCSALDEKIRHLR